MFFSRFIFRSLEHIYIHISSDLWFYFIIYFRFSIRWSMNVLENNVSFLQRVERMTRNMDSSQYSDFCESRQLSFCECSSEYESVFWSDPVYYSKCVKICLILSFWRSQLNMNNMNIMIYTIIFRTNKPHVCHMSCHKHLQMKTTVVGVKLSCHNRNHLTAKKASKFREWLDCSSLDIKPNAMSMEILSYLAYETVAQVSPSSHEHTLSSRELYSLTSCVFILL